MPQPLYFPNASDFRVWLQANAASATELMVGYYKVGSKRPSLSWSESVDEALCFGWIDGVRKRIDVERYQIRFTPRKPNSIWSAVNIAKFEQLSESGRMTEAGRLAFAHRQDAKSGVYAYEQPEAAELSPEESRELKRNKAAWTYFQSTPPSYRKVVLHWVTTAKRPATRASRFAQLLAACAAGERL